MKMATARAALAVLGAGAVAFGIERLGFDDRDNRLLTAADATVGLVLMLCAIVTISRRRTRRLGLLFGLVGVTWLAGAVFAGAAYVHRGPLAHLHLSYPTARVRWRPAVFAIAVAYAGGLWAGQTDLATVLLATFTVLVATAAHRRTTGVARRAGLPALLAAWGLAAVLVLAAVNRLATWQADRPLLWAYYVVVATGVVVLLFDITTAKWANAAAADLVIDLGGRTGTSTLQDALARALDDDTLVVGYWDPPQRRYLDECGEPVLTRDLGPNCATTAVTDAGRPLAMIVHDVTALRDAGLVSAVTAAARLTCVNERLRSDAARRVTSLADSRRRIVEAGDTQRQRLESDLRDRVRNPLVDIGSLLHSAAQKSSAPILGELQRELAQACRELDDFGRGLHPRILTEHGLEAALSALRTPAGLAIRISRQGSVLSPTTARTVYFVCSEALANVAKHAHASTVWIDIEANADRVNVTITDDGVGGADPSRGSGLRGLMDRVESVDGHLTVSGAPCGGTRLQASIPIAPQLAGGTGEAPQAVTAGAGTR